MKQYIIMGGKGNGDPWPVIGFAREKLANEYFDRLVGWCDDNGFSGPHINPNAEYKQNPYDPKFTFQAGHDVTYWIEEIPFVE